jgi:arsenate reductase (thioredoxin)
MSPKKRVLILCTGNSARSQMAEGLLRHAAGDRFEVFSAGTKPNRVRPEAITVMREIGIDISHHRSKSVDEFAQRDFDHVLSVCDNAKESCPVYPGHANRLHHGFDDPAALQGSEAERLAAFRRVRDEIRAYLRAAFPLIRTRACSLKRNAQTVNWLPRRSMLWIGSEKRGSIRESTCMVNGEPVARARTITEHQGAENNPNHPKPSYIDSLTSLFLSVTSADSRRLGQFGRRP